LQYAITEAQSFGFFNGKRFINLLVCYFYFFVLITRYRLLVAGIYLPIPPHLIEYKSMKLNIKKRKAEKIFWTVMAAVIIFSMLLFTIAPLL
jgi:hypothetical protein